MSGSSGALEQQLEALKRVEALPAKWRAQVDGTDQDTAEHSIYSDCADAIERALRGES